MAELVRRCGSCRFDGTGADTCGLCDDKYHLYLPDPDLVAALDDRIEIVQHQRVLFSVPRTATPYTQWTTRTTAYGTGRRPEWLNAETFTWD